MSLHEFDIIKQFFTPLGGSSPSVALGIGDDAAVLTLAAGEQLVVTVDTSNADVHFPADADPVAIAHRSLAVNISDLAAMGARPRWYTLSLSLPEVDPLWLQAFASGLAKLAQQFQMQLVGGDTTRGPLAISIQAMGVVRESYLSRSGAQAGDTVYVSGNLGDAAAGLLVYRLQQADVPAALSDSQQRLLDSYLYPQPQVALGGKLLDVAHSCIDISDGLLQDLGHIASQSGLAARIRLESLPLSKALQSYVGLPRACELALSGGDDYQLCFTAAAAEADQINTIAAELGVAITAIGEMLAGQGVECVDKNGEAFSIANAGYQHF